MKTRIWEPLLRFWAADRSLSILLALLVIVACAPPVLATSRLLGGLARDIAFSLVLVAGAMVALERRSLRLVAAVMAALALVVRWASTAMSSAYLVAWRELASLAALALFAVVVAGRVYRPGPVTLHRILGAVVVYLLLGLTWASAYELLHILRPDAFTGAVGEAPSSQTWIYYSFVTLTTTGYGDITPAHPVARSLAVLEALTGQLYLAITVARLVALYVGTRDDG